MDITFLDTFKEMRSVNWGKLYREYHTRAYSSTEVQIHVKKLMYDDQVTNKRGIFEYVLGGEQDKSLLNVRVFDERTKRKVYKKQTEDAKSKGVSNCPLCALGDDKNKTRIYKLNEMDADHVTAWSKGGSTSEDNCQMLCKTHNRVKGNR